MLDLVTAISEEATLALAIDDLHWADPESREALTVVVSRLQQQRVLLITTARPNYSLGVPRSDGVEIRLSDLSPDEVSALVTSVARLPEEPWARRLPALLQSSCGGSPFQVLEALRYCLDAQLLSRDQEEWVCADAEALDAALRVQSSIDQRRISSLSGSEKSIVLALGVAGMPTPRSIVAEAAGLGEREARESAADLELRGLLSSDEESWMLAHDVIAETVLSNATSEQKTRMRAALGAAMAGSDQASWRKRSIPHLAAAGDWKQVARAAAPFVRERAATGREVNVALGELLGVAANNKTLDAARNELPITVRRPRLVRHALMGIVPVIAGYMILSVAGASKTNKPETAFLLLSADSAGKVQARKVGLDMDHWDAGVPLNPGAPSSVGDNDGLPIASHFTRAAGNGLLGWHRRISRFGPGGNRL